MNGKIKALREKCQPIHKSFPNRPWLFRWYLNNVMKRPSIYITAILAKFHVSPNSVSVFRVILCLINLPLFFSNNVLLIILGTFLMHIALITDCVDGELARLYEVQSLEGSFIDSVTGKPILFTIFTGSAFVAYNLDRTILPLIVVLFLLGIQSMTKQSFNTTLLKLILGGDTSLSANDRGKYSFQKKNLLKKDIKKEPFLVRQSKNAIRSIFLKLVSIYNKVSIILNYLFVISAMSIVIYISLYLSTGFPIILILLIYLLNSILTNIQNAVEIVKSKKITNTIDNLEKIVINQLSKHDNSTDET